jgi:hypothetical protein
MAYTAIPTLSDGAILSASHLNLLADNANYLASLGELPNVAFRQLRTSSAGSTFFHIQHRHRYLKAYYESTNCDYIKIYYNGTQVKNDGDPDAAETYSMDLQTLIPSLVVGNWYEIEVQTAFVGTGELKLKLMWEHWVA